MRVYMYGREVCGRRQGGRKRREERSVAEVREEGAGVWVECG